MESLRLSQSQAGEFLLREVNVSRDAHVVCGNTVKWVMITIRDLRHYYPTTDCCYEALKRIEIF